MDDLYVGNKCTLTLVDFPDNVSLTMENSTDSLYNPTPPTSRRFSIRTWIITVLLFSMNLLNYMDRYVLAGVLNDVKSYYQIDDSEAGVLQTVFVASYMLTAPLFGYLGDRYNRKWIIIGGVIFWSITTVAGSFVPSIHFFIFLLMRAMVGVGEASYSTIAPTILADLFEGSRLTVILVFFYTAIPFGSGLGYIVGSQVAKLGNAWYWALRVTPIAGATVVFLSIIFLKDPPRGSSDGGVHLTPTNIIEDSKAIFKNRTFIWCTVGFTCITYAVGALSWWAPTFMEAAIDTHDVADPQMVALTFGVITCFAGLIGIGIGGGLSWYCKGRYPRADPIICAVGMIISVPALFFTCLIAHEQTALAWSLMFIGITCLCFNWSIISDMTMYVNIPTRRALAQALQITVSHLFGDAVSPYIVGAISDGLKKDKGVSPLVKFQSLQMSLYTTLFLLVIGAASFFVGSFYVEEDRKNCTKATQGSSINTIEPMGAIHRFENEVDEPRV